MTAAPVLRAALWLCIALCPPLAAAQATPARPAAQATPKPAAKPAARKPAPAPAPAAATPPTASVEQLAAAAMAHFGQYDCEFDEKISVDLNPRFEGYLDIKHRKSVWMMKPVLSHTGALRLEDVKGRMLMLQIADKSMLMDTQVGRRLVDNCVHEKQREAMANRKGPVESIGIDPVKTAAAAAAAAASAAAGAASAAEGAAQAASAANAASAATAASAPAPQ